MWKCPECGTELEDQFDTCWNCTPHRKPGEAPPPLPREAAIQGTFVDRTIVSMAGTVVILLGFLLLLLATPESLRRRYGSEEVTGALIAGAVLAALGVAIVYRNAFCLWVAVAISAVLTGSFLLSGCTKLENTFVSLSGLAATLLLLVLLWASKALKRINDWEEDIRFVQLSVEKRLLILDTLLGDGLISVEECEEQKRSILAEI